MSANLDLVRSIYAAWERGDFRKVHWADAEIEFVRPDGPSPGRWTGLAGMAEGTRDVLNAWEAVRIEADEYRELDGERVLVLTHRSGRGKGSGLEIGVIRTAGANVFHVRDGKVTRLALYWDRDRALADLGLAGQAIPEKSTTPDLMELTQRWIDALNARDIDAAMNFFASDVVWEGPFGTLGGRAAVRGYFHDWLSAYDEYEYAAEEVRAVGNGVTFGVLIQRGRPRGTTGWVQRRAGVVATWVDGLVRRTTIYTDIDEARAAAERLAEERG